MNTIEQVVDVWKDDPKTHKLINETFTLKTDEIIQFKALRDWVQVNIWGFGERSFYWMWKLLIDKMPNEFTFLEIGVFRGQILALVQLIATLQGKKVERWGITPLDSLKDSWPSDYEKDIATLHEVHSISKDYTLIIGDSTDQNIIEQAQGLSLDLLYIDGGHQYSTVQSDLKYYLPLLKSGGYLVIDDSGTKFNMPFGYFQGIEEVSDAVDELLPPFTKNSEYTHLFNVMHNRVWMKK